jgi:site-specific DNA-cytosine methylase
MIVIARRDGIKPMLPPATHAESPEVGLFGTLKKWVGWYEAIEDLIPGLPESEFAKWQLERLPEELKTFMINGAGNTNFSEAYPGRGCLNAETPAHTVTTITEEGGSFPRAFIAPGGNANSFSTRNGDEPARTVESVDRVGNIPRAFIVDGQQTNPTEGGRVANVKDSDSPIFTISASQAKGLHTAFVVNSAFPGSNGKKHYMEDEPHFTVDTTTEGWSLAYTSGRVVQMTPRALARFQSFPDSYILPDSKPLACRIIGNAVPPLLYQRIVEGLK